jgi:hypothetical protein
MANLTKEKMDLMSAKVEAAAASKKGKTVFILVDAEGDCTLSETVDKSAYTAYKNGSEIALPSDIAELDKATPKQRGSKKTKAKKQDEVEALLDSEPNSVSTNKSNTKKMTKVKKSAPKKAAKKAAKKSATPAAKREPKGLQELKATSIAEAVKLAKKDGLKKAIVTIKGKTYGLRLATGWAVVKSIVDISKDGMIMATNAGVYVYPKSDFKKLFGKIFASGTYEAIGIYAQSTVAASHDEYLTK